MAYDPGARDFLPPDTPATVEEVRRLRRLLALVAVLALAALAGAAVAYLAAEERSRPTQSRAQLNDIEDKLDEHENSLKRLASSGENLGDRVDELERSRDAGDTGALEQDIERNRAQTVAQEERLEALEQRVDRLAAR